MPDSDSISDSIVCFYRIPGCTKHSTCLELNLYPTRFWAFIRDGSFPFSEYILSLSKISTWLADAWLLNIFFQHWPTHQSLRRWCIRFRIRPWPRATSALARFQRTATFGLGFQMAALLMLPRFWALTRLFLLRPWPWLWPWMGPWTWSWSWPWPRTRLWLRSWVQSHWRLRWRSRLLGVMASRSWARPWAVRWDLRLSKRTYDG